MTFVQKILTKNLYVKRWWNWHLSTLSLTFPVLPHSHFTLSLAPSSVSFFLSCTIFQSNFPNKLSHDRGVIWSTVPFYPTKSLVCSYPVFAHHRLIPLSYLLFFAHNLFHQFLHLHPPPLDGAFLCSFYACEDKNQIRILSLSQTLFRSFCLSLYLSLSLTHTHPHSIRYAQNFIHNLAKSFFPNYLILLSCKLNWTQWMKLNQFTSFAIENFSTLRKLCRVIWFR